mmetsp:Transcript_3581/g.3610  ORF Transcript_3581/g.3610 Transcript_3581/m.3610 type:complete len:271 (-) Transcript_3581:49-861(-)
MGIHIMETQQIPKSKKSPFKISAKSFSLFFMIWVTLTIIVCYIVAVIYGNARLCFPPLDGCSTISNTGVDYPSANIYRFGMVSGISFISIIWFLIVNWLIKTIKKELPSLLRSIVLIAAIGDFFLALGQCLLDPKRPDNVHVIFTMIFFLTNLVGIFYVTIYIEENNKNAKGQFLRIVCCVVTVISIALFLIKVNNTASLEWQVVFAIIGWFSTFILEWDNYYLCTSLTKGKQLRKIKKEYEEKNENENYSTAAGSEDDTISCSPKIKYE